MPDPFLGLPEWSFARPRAVTPVPANMTSRLRGRRVLVGLPGHGWRGDLRADERVVQGSRTFVPVMPEGEWYRAEAETLEVFAPLVPIERVWVEELGLADTTLQEPATKDKLVSMDEPQRRQPIAALDADSLMGRRMVQLLEDGGEQRDLRAVTELHTSNEGVICARIASELEWYRWGWSGRIPRTLEVSVHLLWVE